MGTAKTPRKSDAQVVGSRRGRYISRSGVLLLAVCAVSLFASVIADEVNARVDVTASREHQLSPKTERIIGELGEGVHEIVIAAAFGTRSRQGVERLEDVLKTLERSAPNIQVTVIDTGSSNGLVEFDAFIGRLGERFGPGVLRGAEQLAEAAADAERIATDLEEARGRVTNVADSIEPESVEAMSYRIRAALINRARSAEQSAEALRQRAETARNALGTDGPIAGLPDVETARRWLDEAITLGAEELGAITEDMRLIGQQTDTLSDETRARARDAMQATSIERDGAAVDLDQLRAIPRQSVLQVARALEQSSAGVVIAPPGTPGLGITAMELDAMLPPRAATGNARIADLRFRSEEILGSALLAVSGRPMPTLVLMHGLPRKVAPNYPGLRGMVDRLELRGMTVLEWAPAADPAPPSVAPGTPVVYMVIPTESTSADGAVRMGQLSDQVSRLFAQGERMLICAQPSTLPMRSAPDPMVDFLREGAGLRVETGRPLLRQVGAETNRQVLWEHRLVDPGTDHPIGAGVAGLPMALRWPVPIRPQNADAFGEGITPILVFAGESARGMWAESEWLRYSEIPEAQRAAAALQAPTPDDGRDLTGDTWTVGVAIDRRTPEGVPQRAVVIGANGWYFDQSQGSTLIDGRVVTLNPGNLELLESSILWLAGDESLIGASASARAAPTIGAISEGTRRTITWALIGGLPALVLALGGFVRLVRG